MRRLRTKIYDPPKVLVLTLQKNSNCILPGNIWFGGRSNEGVFRYDGKSVTNLKINEQQPPNNWYWPVLQDKNANIWFSNWNGAYRYDGKTFTSFSEWT